MSLNAENTRAVHRPVWPWAAAGGCFLLAVAVYVVNAIQGVMVDESAQPAPAWVPLFTIVSLILGAVALVATVYLLYIGVRGIRSARAASTQRT